MQKTYQADVIIVGGGIAGIIAALELLDAGKKVLILDRDKASELGGLAKWAFGGMFFVDTKIQKRQGIKDSIDLAMKDWFSYAEFEEDEYWGKQWAEQYIHLSTPHAFRWLLKKDIKFFFSMNWAERGLERKGNSVPRFHMVWGTGHALVNKIKEQILHHVNKQNLTIHFEHRVLDLTTTNNVVDGVNGIKENDEGTFMAKSNLVIVATGGINGSIERVKKEWDHKAFGSPPKTILNGAHKYAIGDLHDATARINGNIVNLEKQWNYAAGIRHFKPRKTDHGLSLVPCKSAIWTNYQGKRFGPTPLMTATDTRYLIERICKEPVKYSWQILNMKIANKEFAISGSEFNHNFREQKLLKFLYSATIGGNKKLVKEIAEKCEDVVIANSFEELVDKMNAISDHEVSLALLKESVENYDADIANGPSNFKDQQLQWIEKFRKFKGDKIRTCKFQKINDPKAYPLIAIREFIVSRKSLGGIQTNLEGKVLTSIDKDGNQSVIEGLYAIGEAAGFGGGGMHGKRSLEGTFLGGCVITARVAAKSILGKQLN